MEVQPATSNMFDAIYEVLLESFGPGKLQKADWKRLLDYEFGAASDVGALGPRRARASRNAGSAAAVQLDASPPEAEPQRGWVLIDRGSVVGFLGAIYSRRGAERFCNLSAWGVKKSHRKAGLELLVPVLELEDHTITNLSPSAFTVEVFRRMGFVTLEDRLVIIPPVLPQLAPPGYELLTERSDIERVLSSDDLRIYRDHASYACTHLVFAGARDYSYVVASNTRFRRYPATFVYYRSNPELFGRLAGPMQRAFLRLHRTPFTIVDARLTKGAPLRACPTRTLMQPRLYRPAPGARKPGGVDTLYSELVVLNPERWTFNY